MKVDRKRFLRIVMIQIINRNLGDGVIADCAEYLIKRSIPYKYKNAYTLFPYNIYSEDYEIIRHADLIIFVGGGIIKYKYEKFYIYITNILTQAQRYCIPVLFNGVGVEGYDEQDERCQNLKKALNFECVKTITVRDDLKNLRENYIPKSNIVSKSVYDSAVWIKETYQVKRDKKADKIGLGIVRHKIFSDNGIEKIDRDYLLKFWKEIIWLCERHGIKWQIFTNGLKSDEEFAVEVLEYAGFGQAIDQHKACRLNEASELVDLISGYKAIIASRLHANIIAHVLGIPSIAPVWNDKLVFWGKRIGHEERFISAEELNSEKVFNSLLTAMSSKEEKIPFWEKHMNLQEIKKFIKEYGTFTDNKEQQRHNWEECLIATALGGKNYLYCNMNSISTLENSIQEGFHWLELDVRLTADDKLVCVNGWNKPTYEKLEMNTDQFDQKMKYVDFMKAKYYGKYSTCDLKQFFRAISLYSHINIVLDIGKPDKKKLAYFYEQLLETIPSELNSIVYMRLQREYDVTLAEEKRMPYSIMYYLEHVDSLERVIQFSKQKNIIWITMKSTVITRNICQTLHADGLKVCTFSANSYSDILRLHNLGADKISVHYLSPKKLTEMGI